MSSAFGMRWLPPRSTANSSSASARPATGLSDGDRIEVLAPMQGAEMSTFYGVELGSRLMIGTARFPSPAILAQAIRASAAEVATVSLRREPRVPSEQGQAFWSIIRELGVRVLPNTAGCRSVKEAVTTAHMAARSLRHEVDQAGSHR